MISDVLCMFCKKKLREMETDHGNPSHGICIPCAEKYYGIKIDRQEVRAC